jgi:hypothetical protein
VLSALYGLVRPEQVIEPYDLTLKSQPAKKRREWAVGVLRALERELGGLSAYAFEVHAGAAYRDYGLIEGLLNRGADVEVPAAGLSQGEQLAFYAHASPTAQLEVTSGSTVLDDEDDDEPAREIDSIPLSTNSWRASLARGLEALARRVRGEIANPAPSAGPEASDVQALSSKVSAGVVEACFGMVKPSCVSRFGSLRNRKLIGSLPRTASRSS